MMKMSDNHQREGTTKKKQITNREVKTDPVVDPKSLIKHPLAGLNARVREAPLS